ncbi:hypothetical protein ADUPG1_002445, partial [Aduncisulcus paluster]
EIISDTQRDFLSQRYPGSIIPYILPKERSLLPKTYKFSGITPPKYKDPYDNHVLGVCPICRKKVDFTASVRRELWLERLNSLLCSCKVCSATGSHREMTHHLSQHVLELYNPDKSKDKQLIPTSPSSFSSFFPPAPHFSTFISVGSSVCISLRPHLILGDVSSHPTSDSTLSSPSLSQYSKASHFIGSIPSGCTGIVVHVDDSLNRVL